MKKTGFTHESSRNETKEWYTPKPIFDALGLTFDLDVCSPGQHIVPWIPVQKHLTIQDDGLTAKWEGTVWCNPPYGSDTKKWLKKMYDHNNGIALVFARTDTKWFHEFCLPANAILLMKGRVKFIRYNEAKSYELGKGINKASTTGSMLVAYGTKCESALYRASSILGPVFKHIDDRSKSA